MERLECIHSGICHLGEGPVWNVQRRKLYWTDIYNRRIWEYDPAEGVSSIFWEGGLQVGGFAFTHSDGLVLCSDKGVYLLDTAENPEIRYPKAENPETQHPETQHGKHRLHLLYDFAFAENEMFNDITVDPAGRIFAGTITRPGMTGGILYRLEKGKKPVVLLQDLHCSNGMTFSPDEKYFYHTDSKFQTIKRYEYNKATGDIGNPSVYFRGVPEMGSPDGMTMDSEGCIWSAFWGGSCVRRLDPGGRIISEIKVPAKQPSSVMFGGAGLSELFITTACEDADDIETGCCSDGAFLGGPVYRCIPGVKGRAEWLADF